MRGLRKNIAGMVGVISLFIGGLFFVPDIYSNYMYGVVAITVSLISGNAAVHFFQNRGKK